MLRLSERQSFICRPGLGRILEEHTRLVAIFSHSSPLSWIPSVSFLCIMAARSGHGDRVPIGVMDRFFYQVPFLKPIAEYITQSDRALSFDELVGHFENRERTDLVLFPEGSNCFFGDPHDMQLFRSPRFLEIAIRAGAPLLLNVHRGSEHWAVPMQFSSQIKGYMEYLPSVLGTSLSSFLASKAKNSGLLTLPLPPLPIRHFRMLTELYVPKLQVGDLAENAEERRLQIAHEAEEIRLRMMELLAELDAHEDS